MSYWDETDNYLSSHGGHGPACPYCGAEMFAEDDHGRFSCFCGGDRISRRRTTLDVVSGTTIETKPTSGEANDFKKKGKG